MRDDATRLLGEDGLRDTPVLVISALTGVGLEELRSLRRAGCGATRPSHASRRTWRLRRDAAAVCGDTQPPGVQKEERERLVAALSEAAGVPRRGWGRRTAAGARLPPWPFVRWVRRPARPAPAPSPRRGRRRPGAFRENSMPPATDVQRAQVATAVRALADEAGAGLSPPWPALVRASAAADEARSSTGSTRPSGQQTSTRPRRDGGGVPAPATPRRGLGVGAVWIGLAGSRATLRIEDVVPLPERNGAPIATWLLVGGARGRLLLAPLTRLANAAGARRRRAARACSARGSRPSRTSRRRPVERARAGRARDASPVARRRGGRKGPRSRRATARAT